MLHCGEDVHVGEGGARAANVGSVGEYAEVAVDDPEEVKQLRRLTRVRVHRGVAQDVMEERWEAGVSLYELPTFHFIPFPDQ